MLTPTEITRDLVLVGGGHAHALVLRMLAMNPVPGARLTLVSPASHTPYSGMLPGLVAGHYRFEDTHIDLARLCQWAGVRFLRDAVTALDPARRELHFAERPPLGYDLLSLDIGSQPTLDVVPGACEHAVPVKPVAEFWQRWQAGLAAHGGQRIAVVGGGAGGLELALAMAHALAGSGATLVLYCGGELLPGYHRAARAAARDAISRLGVTLEEGARVAEVHAGELSLEDGRRERFDSLYWCTAAAAAPWVRASGLAVDERGFLAVDDTLRSVDDGRIFGAGDIATQVNHPRPKAGVYAVRQGPVLARNLRASLTGVALREHRPQQRFLSLLSLGEQRATADRGPLSATGHWVWRWKDRIDRSFMRRFSELPRMQAGREDTVPAQAPCGGCGAKVGGDPLAEALAALRADFPDHCLPAGGAAEDAAALPQAGGTLLQSLDTLRALVDDPWLMGRIAAQHALNDLYASGARPRAALAALTLPFAAASVQARDLRQVLAGALAAFAEADCVLLGGHSLQGPEWQLGFAVTGEVATKDPLRKRGAQAGDALLLTRPLGVGVLFAAHMQLAADGRDIDRALALLGASQAAALDAAVAGGAHAATDVTGFGLAGHLCEMLCDELGATLDLAALPVLPGAEVAIAAGLRSTAAPANLAAWGARVLGAGDPVRQQLLFDPQTAGGLLLALPPAGVPEARRVLEAAKLGAAVIGECVAAEPGMIRLADAS
ncbi:MAG: selenide, water dikinase SelD [Pseudohaliea sp.]